VTVVVVSLNHLQPHHAPALAEQLSKFPALKHLDVSDNPELRCTGAAVMLSALSGMLPCDAHSVLLSVSRVIADSQGLELLLWKSSICREQALWMRRRPCWRSS
jgi:hypothetical protein